MDSNAFKKLSQLEHVLQRPTTYIGSISKTPSSIWVYDPPTKKIKKINHEYPQALEQLYQEAFANCNDNVHRSRQMKINPGKIEQSITSETATFYNEGAWVPVEIHPEEKIYVPELIFFNLLTSSNYNDNQDRTWIGQNGIGIKAVAVFSEYFEIECADPKNKLLYKQRSENNLKVLNKPTITPYKGNTGYTKVTFKPDFARFEMTSFTPEMINMFKFFTISASFTSKIPMVFNNEVFNYSSIESYSSLFITDEKTDTLKYKVDGQIEFCLIDAPEKGFHVSFVNGGFTKKGGSHVNDILKFFSSSILEKLNKKKKTLDVRDVKKHLGLIISCTVNNPKYTTQSKEEFVSPVPKIEIKDNILKRVDSWSFAKQLALYAELKAGGGEKESKKRNKYVIIEKAIDANLAGTSEYSKTVAGLTEGDSANTFLLKYRSLLNKGEDIIGALPLRGKFLNVQKANVEKIQANNELQIVREFLGLKVGLDYTTKEARNSLRYGHCLLATDADVDGFHIQGLLLNLFGTSYTSLLKIGFVWGLITPIVRFHYKDIDKYFYTEPEFELYWKNVDEKIRNSADDKNFKYYKGLGSWDKSEFTPENIKLFKIVQYVYDETAPYSLNLAFSDDKKIMSLRKEWVSSCSIPPPIYENDKDDGISQTITNFINSKLKLYAKACNERNIPNIMDNYVPSRRKVQYALKKKKIGENKSVKIENFAGYVAENTVYPHGKDNIDEILFNMAQDFTGSNNIPLINGIGEIGTQIKGGKDHSASRYVSMKDHPLNKYYFREEDDSVLKYTLYENNYYEPDYYCPVVCMTAINGSQGIGVGHSTSCPSYHPKKVLEWQRSWIVNLHPEEGEVSVGFPTMIPWFRGFKGVVRDNGNGRYITEGIFNVVGNKITIKELPVGYWIMDYKKFVDKLLSDGKISDRRDKVDASEYWFELTNFQDTPNLKNLNLTSSFCISNLVFFDSEGNICKYNSIEALLHDYCSVRFNLYDKRRNMQLKVLEDDINSEKLKIRFIRAVVSKDVDVTSENVETEMIRKGFPLDFLKLSLRSITPEGLKRHENELSKIEEKYNELKNTTPRRMWMKDMKEFEEVYNKMYPSE